MSFERSEDDDVIDAINFLLSSGSLSLTDSEAHSGPFLLLLGRRWGE